MLLQAMLMVTVSAEECRQDIGFIIDGSSSITNSDFEKVKTWLSSTVQGQQI